ncbi:MAG: hypothetical protein AB1657_05370 [Candidatus Micrarchaeota archaeon]
MRGGVWIFRPVRRPMPESARATITRWAEAHVAKLKHTAIPKMPPKNQNYVADVFYEWIRDRFYLCAKYSCPGPNAISPYFIDKFARLEHIGDDRYQLFAMRHTGQWMPVERHASLKKCLDSMESGPWFQVV